MRPFCGPVGRGTPPVTGECAATLSYPTGGCGPTRTWCNLIAMRGRDRELTFAAKLLGAAEQGRGGVLLIEGEPGIGKSAFLGTATDRAAARNFSLAVAAADELSQHLPFAPLFAALREPAADLTGDAAQAGGPEVWMPVVHQIGTLLRRRVAESPVLVSLDDLQYADPATLFALHHLPRQLLHRPLAWLLARRTFAPRGPAGALFDLLRDDGAARLILPPLDEQAWTGMIADLLGAVPDTALVKLASGAAGNPLLLAELVRGLREENAIRLNAETATLVTARLPQRILAVARNRLDALREPARHLAETAAVLGPAFQLEDVAEMLGSKPATLVPLVNEAVAAGLLAVSADHLGFRHQLIWRAVTEAVAPPVRQAMHRQFGELLLARGGSAVAAADHLLKGGRQSDPAVVLGLDAAVEEILRSSPQTAADLALRALRLTEAADPARFTRTLRAADALAAAARLEEAASIVQAAMAQPQSAKDDTELRCTLTSVLCLQGKIDDAKTEAETVLRRPQLSGSRRDEVLVAYLQALTALGNHAKARRVTNDILAAPGEYSEPTLAAALSTLAAICWNEGRLDRGLHLASEAVRRTARITADARHFQPLLGYAARLVDLRRLDTANKVIQASADLISSFRPNVTEVIPPVLRARMDLALGQIDSARAEAEQALSIADTFDTQTHSALARSILSVIALRKGDLRAAALHLRSRPESIQYLDIYALSEATLAHAQFVEAEAGPQTAMKALGNVYAGLSAHRHILIGDPTAAAWLARTALAAGHADLASGVAHVADELAQDNPRFDVVTAAAEHCGGVVTGDLDRLAHAAATHPDPWARASAAEDIGMVLAMTTDPGQAVMYLDNALGGYGSAGAERDLARVRRRLRRLGVRRRTWTTADRPAAGWESLTDAELATCILVAQGLTNQQVAEQMYVTANTVAFHLRQVYRKLGISSRVELARQFAGRERG
jgi:DNA-binding CsgD family transcriptional regulator/tetratricopeptide (TPR) repeat protein